MRFEHYFKDYFVIVIYNKNTEQKEGLPDNRNDYITITIEDIHHKIKYKPFVIISTTDYNLSLDLFAEIIVHGLKTNSIKWYERRKTGIRWGISILNHEYRVNFHVIKEHLSTLEYINSLESHPDNGCCCSCIVLILILSIFNVYLFYS